MTCRHAETCNECATIAVDLRAEVTHWQSMAGMYLAAARASITAKSADAVTVRLVPLVAGAEPTDAPQDVQPDLRAAERRTA